MNKSDCKNRIRNQGEGYMDPRKSAIGASSSSPTPNSKSWIFKQSSSGGGEFRSNISNFPSLAFLFLVLDASLLGLWRRMWPPKACPMPNTMPHTVHSWTVGFDGAAVLCARWPTLNRLWVVQWPPSAWNEEKLRLHVLHSNVRPILAFATLHESRTRRFATELLSRISPLSSAALKRFVIANEGRVQI